MQTTRLSRQQKFRRPQMWRPDFVMPCGRCKMSGGCGAMHTPCCLQSGHAPICILGQTMDDITLADHDEIGAPISSSDEPVDLGGMRGIGDMECRFKQFHLDPKSKKYHLFVEGPDCCNLCRKFIGSIVRKFVNKFGFHPTYEPSMMRNCMFSCIKIFQPL